MILATIKHYLKSLPVGTLLEVKEFIEALLLTKFQEDYKTQQEDHDAK